jgi:hypothetical protein
MYEETEVILPAFAPAVEVHMDYVVVEGVRVDRPSRLSRSQWVYFWEEVTGAL